MISLLVPTLATSSQPNKSPMESKSAPTVSATKKRPCVYPTSITMCPWTPSKAFNSKLMSLSPQLST